MKATINENDYGLVAELSIEESQVVQKLVKDVTYNQERTTQDNDVVRLLVDSSNFLPLSLRQELERFRCSDLSYMVIKGLPKDKTSEALLLITSQLGVAFAHKQETELVSIVKPKNIALKPNETGYYTWNKFDLHSELPYVKDVPDYLCLLCKYNVENGFTYTASVQKALELLIEEDKFLLAQPEFQIMIPPHFGHSESHADLRPIIEPYGSSYRIRIRFDGIKLHNQNAKGALERLYQALNEVRTEHLLQPGEMLVINNNTALHGRSEFAPSFKPNDRELHRVYLYREAYKLLSKFDYVDKRISGF